MNVQPFQLKKKDMPRVAVLWAKDRLVDDMEDFIHGWSQVDTNGAPRNFAARDQSERRAFQKKLQKLVDLLALPETDPASLKALQRAGYWNGARDTFWAGHVAPPKS